MADLNVVKLPNNNSYNVSDNFSKWGGENLLKNIPRVHAENTYQAYGFDLTENLIKGETYTLQFWGAEVTRSDKDAAWIRPYWGGGNVVLGVNLYPDENGYCKCTFVAPDNSHETTGNAWLNIYNSPGWVAGVTPFMHINKWKLEKGHKATDWSPCYKDIFTVSGTQLQVNL